MQRIVKQIYDYVLKVNSWKQVFLIISVLMMSFMFHIANKMDLDKLIDKNRIEITEDLANEVMHTREKIVARTVMLSPVVDSIIQSLLGVMNEKTGFNRSSLWLYHDNITMVNGVPYSRMSMSHELVTEKSLNVVPQMVNMQNIPVSMFAYGNKILFKNEFICTSVDSLRNIEYNSYMRYSELGVKSFSIKLIKDKKTNLPMAALAGYSYDTLLVCNRRIEEIMDYNAIIISDLLQYDKNIIDKYMSN